MANIRKEMVTCAVDNKTQSGRVDVMEEWHLHLEFLGERGMCGRESIGERTITGLYELACHQQVFT